ncbi:hypothetical protein [Kineococcus esterisolvens]|uniref:hypothetical protein n=1 Tax=unclassified Kineococcus TaxID=2621656 RepID=UPI003D7D5AB7
MRKVSVITMPLAGFLVVLTGAHRITSNGEDVHGTFLVLGGLMLATAALVTAGERWHGDSDS